MQGVLPMTLQTDNVQTDNPLLQQLKPSEISAI
jgi:hypothetical protein